MDFSKAQKLENKINEFKDETGLSDSDIRKLIVKKYLLGDEEKSADEMMGDFLHPKREE